MRRFSGLIVLGVCLAGVLESMAVADDPITLENVTAPAANRADEALAESFSPTRAIDFLDAAALSWQKSRRCFTCHTNYAYLYARPMVQADAAAHLEVRNYAEQLVEERWESSGPRWDAEVVATAAALAFNDAHTSGSLQPVTRKALDRMWTVQKANGGFDWLKCGWPPMESDDHYGVTIAAIAVGVASDSYADSAEAKRGMAGIKRYLEANPAPTLHHRAMLLWARSYNADLMEKDQRKQIVAELLKKQKPDGGWSVATLGDWKRADGLEQDSESSDGYGTGFVIYVLRRSGVPATDPKIQQGIAWLKNHQRESGRWFTRSLNRDNHHYLSHAGSAFAVMALAECNEFQP